ncbi:MAG TPA: hypothetical protein VGI70_11195, partial [Polyangiales bacterium]
MTQYELLFELDCAAEDVGPFLYGNEGGSPRRLALGSLIDLVTSAFDLSGAREAIEFDLDVEALPDETMLARLRLQLSPASGLFVVDFATFDPRNGHKRILSGQRHDEIARPDWLSDREIQNEVELPVDAFAWPAAFAVIERAHQIGRGASLRFALADAAQRESSRFSMHPWVLTLALQSAARCLDESASRSRIRCIERIAIVVPGAIAAGL